MRRNELAQAADDEEDYDVPYHQLNTNARRPTEEEEKKWLRLG